MGTCDVGIELNRRHASNNWIDATTWGFALKSIGRSYDASYWLLQPEWTDGDDPSQSSFVGPKLPIFQRDCAVKEHEAACKRPDSHEKPRRANAPCRLQLGKRTKARQLQIAAALISGQMLT